MMKRPVGKAVIKRPYSASLRYTRVRPAARVVPQHTIDSRFVLTSSKWALVTKLIAIGWIRPLPFPIYIHTDSTPKRTMQRYPDLSFFFDRKHLE